MLDKTAFVLIGYQADYFSSNGILHPVVKESLEKGQVLENTKRVLDSVVESQALIISTPIVFSPDYRELHNPIGILRTIREVGAFKKGSPGSEVIPEIQEYGSRVQEVPGKCSLNAFHETSLDVVLEAKGIEHLVLMGVVTSVCIDSTARAAVDKGLHIIVLKDCTASRSTFEQDFYCNDIFPIFAEVKKADELLEALLIS
jgi:nicotinamidase-related amidase